MRVKNLAQFLDRMMPQGTTWYKRAPWASASKGFVILGLFCRYPLKPNVSCGLNLFPLVQIKCPNSEWASRRLGLGHCVGRFTLRVRVTPQMNLLSGGESVCRGVGWMGYDARFRCVRQAGMGARKLLSPHAHTHTRTRTTGMARARTRGVTSSVAILSFCYSPKEEDEDGKITRLLPPSPLPPSLKYFLLLPLLGGHKEVLVGGS